MKDVRATFDTEGRQDTGLLYEKDLEKFKDEIIEAKGMIGKVGRCSVDGYRSACFSNQGDKFDSLAHDFYNDEIGSVKFK